LPGDRCGGLTVVGREGRSALSRGVDDRDPSLWRSWWKFVRRASALCAPRRVELRAQLAERDRSIVILVEESAALHDRVDRLIEQVKELQCRLDQNARKSHEPPASEGYEKPAPRSRRERTDRQAGGQPGHEGRTLRQVATPDEQVEHFPTAWAGCGASLGDVPVVSTECRQVFDLLEIVLRVVKHAPGASPVRLWAAHDGCGSGPRSPRRPGTGLGCGGDLSARRPVPAVGPYRELLSELVGAQVSEGTLAGWYPPPTCWVRMKTGIRVGRSTGLGACRAHRHPDPLHRVRQAGHRGDDGGRRADRVGTRHGAGQRLLGRTRNWTCCTRSAGRTCCGS